MGVWDAPPLPARAAGKAKPVFVGRAAETAAAEQGWTAVRSGARELIFIGGEPGAGKSRLVEEIAAALHRRGAVVLFGTCSPEPGPGYEPFVECLEQLLGGTAEGVLAEYLRGSARELRDEARRLAASTGQVRLIRMLDTPTAHAAGLTAREIDVLRLISRGRSNRDIAAELRITENTAANHVRSILIKTGAANRTQVAMMAVSRRWVDDHAPEFTP